MKDLNLNNSIKDFKKVGLSRDEKNCMLSGILNKPIVLPIKSPFSIRSFVSVFDGSIFSSRKMAYATFLALFFVSSIGVSRAAEMAVPGDILYPIKVDVNEPLRGVAAVTKEEKVAWETEKVGRRLEEARVLASRGQLNDENRKTIEGQLSASSDVISSMTPANEQSEKETRDGNAATPRNDGGRKSDDSVSNAKKQNGRNPQILRGFWGKVVSTSTDAAAITGVSRDMRDATSTDGKASDHQETNAASFHGRYSGSAGTFESKIETETRRLNLVKDSSDDDQRNQIQKLEDNVREDMSNIKERGLVRGRINP